MRKWQLRSKICGIFLLGLASVFLSGCGRQAEVKADSADESLKIVCTIFPEYDWVKQLLGDRADGTEITLLMKNGTDMHSYQPTVWDMRRIAEADLFLYVGGESDFWVDAVLRNMQNSDRIALNLMDILKNSVREEEYVEGMQEGRGHEDHEEEEEPEYDEHVWLSLCNAGIVCTAITDALCELDGAHEKDYRKNCADYQVKLRTLDQDYCQLTESLSEPTLLFGDRFPFRYLIEDYGLSYYAAFAGCSAETEASFHTIAYLAEKTDELSLPAVLTIDGSDQSVAKTIAGSTRKEHPKVLMLDSMQSVSQQDIEDGETYLAIMERNLSVLKEALPRNY